MALGSHRPWFGVTTVYELARSGADLRDAVVLDARAPRRLSEVIPRRGCRRRDAAFDSEGLRLRLRSPPLSLVVQAHDARFRLAQGPQLIAQRAPLGHERGDLVVGRRGQRDREPRDRGADRRFVEGRGANGGANGALFASVRAWDDFAQVVRIVESGP
jgi:hypothetical protein